MVRLVVASCLVLASAFPPTGLTQPRLKGSGVIVGIVVDEHQVPVPRALVQAFLAEDVRKASTNSQRLGRSKWPRTVITRPICWVC